MSINNRVTFEDVSLINDKLERSGSIKRIAAITPSPDGKTFTAKTEFSSVKKAEEMETDDLLSLQFGMQTAEMMVNKKKLTVMDGVHKTPND